jgi:hypothetical protein
MKIHYGARVCTLVITGMVAFGAAHVVMQLFVDKEHAVTQVINDLSIKWQR